MNRPRPMDFKPVDEWRDVYDFLDQVRRRPSTFVRHGSLLELQSILYGYSVACKIHEVSAVTDFDHLGPFSEWLWPRLGMQHSSLGWEVEIKRAAETAGIPPLDMFFSLLDEFRADATGSRCAPCKTPSKGCPVNDL